MKIYLLSLVALLIGCSPEIRTFQAFSTTFALDFTEYTEKGFYISPSEYPGDFIPIGIISKTLYPGAKKNTYQSSEFYQHGWWTVEDIDRERILEEMYQEAIAMGANGIVNLKVQVDSRQADENRLTLPVINVEAFAIKIP